MKSSGKVELLIISTVACSHATVPHIVAKHLPLQVMDLVLGSICFRLNDKQKDRDIDGRRAKRNIVKERIYKYIQKKISELHPGFNIGITTPITKQSDLWEMPYLHWNFVPKNHKKDKSLTKRHKKEIAPCNLHK